MAVPTRRLWLILALLFALVGTTGVPVYAGPTAKPLPLPTLSGRDPIPEDEPDRTYDYPSVSFWRDELKWNSPKLTTNYLNDIKGHAAYKGQVGTEGHLLSAWKDYTRRIKLPQWETLTDEQKRAAWEEYLDRYTSPLDGNAKGRAFEALYDSHYKLKQAGYNLDSRFPGISSRRRGDAFTSDEGGVIIELKSGSSPIDRAQARFLAEQAIRLKKKLAYVFSEEPQESDLKFLEDLNTELAPKGKALISHHRWPATANPVRHPNAPPPPAAGAGKPGPAPSTGPSSGGAGSLATGGQHLAESGSTSAVANSPSSPEVATALAESTNELAQELGYQDAADADMTGEQLGGVDFSTLELRYVSDAYDGGVGAGVRYAYQVDAKPGTEVSFGGRQAAQLAADSFFTWLVLQPSRFTVNLNPDEPDRIIDAQLGKTDAGRVLLEADLQMKKTVAKLIHPDTPQGQAFWNALHGETSCLSMRQWIVPRPAVVRESDNELFILDAPLEVKMETEYFKSQGSAGAGCSGQAKSDTTYNEAVYRAKILPEVEKAVNTAPEYADLRRVYASRVAAEWYRQRSAKKDTPYRHLIDSGDVSAWPSRVAWTPRQVFDRYVQSFKNGEFKVERTTRQGDLIVTQTYVYGGVDFSHIPKKTLSKDQFTRDRPGLRDAAGRALFAPAAENGKDKTWLGGRSSERPLSARHPKPTLPLRMPHFYVLTALPVLAWLVIGGYLLRRRRRPVSAGRVTS
jgi:hypothetical protein